MKRALRTLLFSTCMILVHSDRAAATTYAFVAATDFSSGCASWVESAPPRTAHDCVEALSSDPVCR